MNPSENTLPKLELKAARLEKAQKRANELLVKLRAQDGPHEIWKPVERFPNHEVSNLGRVRSLPRASAFSHWFTVFRGGLRRLSKGRCGYSVVHMRCGDEVDNPPVHRLVAAAFIPNPDRKPQVNHLNGIKTDNRVLNLEWATHQENMDHAARVLKVNTGESCSLHKLTEQQVVEIKSRRNCGETVRSLARTYAVSTGLVSGIANRKKWRHVP